MSTAVLYGSNGFTSQSLPRADLAPLSSYSSRSVTGSVTATVSRPLRLYGSLRLQPTAGVIAEASRLLSFETNLSDFNPNRSQVQAGVLLEFPISLRVLGSDVTLAPGGVLPVTGNDYGYRYAGGGLRVNF